MYPSLYIACLHNPYVNSSAVHQNILVQLRRALYFIHLFLSYRATKQQKPISYTLKHNKIRMSYSVIKLLNIKYIGILDSNHIQTLTANGRNILRSTWLYIILTTR